MHSKFSARTLLGFSNALAPVFAVVMALFAGAVFAADVTSTWSTATSGIWNVDANWTNVPAQGGFPNNGNGGVATYDAVISPVGAPYTVTLNTNVTVEDLLLSSANATLSHTSGTLTATGAINLAAGTYSLAGGTIDNSTVNATVPINFTNASNTLSGVTVNGDLTLNTTSAATKIAGGTTFTQAHLAANATSLGFAPGQTLSGTILFEGAIGGNRVVEMNGTAGAFTIGASGVIRTNAGLTGDGNIGGAQNFGGAMTLANAGLISSQVSGRTITISTVSLNSTGTLEANNGGILNIATDSTLAGLGTLSNTGGTINLSGNINNQGNTSSFSPTGAITLAGGRFFGGGSITIPAGALLITANTQNRFDNVAINGDLTLNTTSASAQILGGASFLTAHLAANATSLGFAPGQTL
ncbi:MAG: hypothetical protein WD738_17185, partial [Pirellulales bacterium]